MKVMEVEVTGAKPWWDAERYHQKYFRKQQLLLGLGTVVVLLMLNNQASLGLGFAFVVLFVIGLVNPDLVLFC